MILADKIIILRKKNGWSQEELAEKMNVSRQAVSKWEAAQTTPDLEKILKLSKLFGVTTDYLLKDEVEVEEYTNDVPDGSARKNVTMEEANSYVELRTWASKKISLATMLCILSPISLFVLGVLAEEGKVGIPENMAGLFGLMLLFIHIAVAVAIYIYVDAQNRPYRFLDEEEFELAYGVSGMIRERQKKFYSTYVKGNITGTCLCILAPVILLIGAFTEHGIITVIMLAAMFVVVAIGVWQFISVGVIWASMERLLREGEFSKKERNKSKVSEAIGTIYWLVATALYLGWSFITNDWQITWVVWPVAAVLYAALMVVVDLFVNKVEQ